MTLLLALIYVLNSIAHDLVRQKSWDKSMKQFQMIKIFKKEIFIVFTHWIGYIAYTHLALLVQKLLSTRIITLKVSNFLSTLLE